MNRLREMTIGRVEIAKNAAGCRLMMWLEVRTV